MRAHKGAATLAVEHCATSLQEGRNSKFASFELYGVQDCRIDSASFGKRVVNLGELAAERWH